MTASSTSCLGNGAGAAKVARMGAQRKPRARERAAVLPFPRGPVAAGELLPSGRSVAAGLALLALAAGSYALARGTSLFAVEGIRVEGAPPALAREVRAALAPVVGSSLVALDGDAVVGSVEAIPGVLAAGYDRSFPHTLVVTVRRERPAAVVRRGRESWLVSARGRVLRTLPRGDHARLPRVWVPKRVSVREGDRLSSDEALRAVRAATALLGSPLPRRVTAVRVGAADLTFLLAGGLELRLGDETDLPLKLAVAREVLPLAGGAVYLDVSVPERPVSGQTLESKVEVEG